MVTLSKRSPRAGRIAEPSRSTPPSATHSIRQLSQWGGAAGLAGVAMMLGTVFVVVAFGLPDASDAETLTDFENIEAGRVAEHFLYLGALVLFALHALVLHRLLQKSHPAAALFGTAVAGIGYVILAASSMLHVSTAPLSDLFTAADTTAEDRQAIEYSWHGAQSVFDTMLATGLLLVPIGLGLLGVAMKGAKMFGERLTWATFGLASTGFVGAAIAIIDPSSDASAASVLAIVLFHLVIGWRTLALGTGASDADAGIDLTG